MRALRRAILLFVMATVPVVGGAQWLNYPTPGIPRLASGAPDLKAPAPRLPFITCTTLGLTLSTISAMASEAAPGSNTAPGAGVVSISTAMSVLSIFIIVQGPKSKVQGQRSKIASYG